MFKHAIAPVIAFAATVAIFAIPDAAIAEPASNSVTVRYSDLNLDTAEGQKKLEQRIDRAASTVCGLDAIKTGTILRSHQAMACYRQALRDVRSSVATAVTSHRPAG